MKSGVIPWLQSNSLFLISKVKININQYKFYASYNMK